MKRKLRSKDDCGRTVPTDRRRISAATLPLSPDFDHSTDAKVHSHAIIVFKRALIYLIRNSRQTAKMRRDWDPVYKVLMGIKDPELGDTSSQSAQLNATLAELDERKDDGSEPLVAPSPPPFTEPKGQSSPANAGLTQEGGAPHKMGNRKPPSLTIADADRIYELEGSDAADAAMQQIAREQEAREHEAMTAIEEIHNPLAIQKKMAANWLKARGFTDADLPPDFWSRSEDKRRWALWDLAAEANARKREDKRIKWAIERGYPANYYSLPDNERRRISNNVRKRRERATKATNNPKPVAPNAATSIPSITREWLKEHLDTLRSWTTSNHPVARQLRGREPEFVKADAVHRQLRAILGREPSYAKFAAEIRCTRRAARNRLKVLRTLRSTGGPWSKA